jgi:hypothetical protein
LASHFQRKIMFFRFGGALVLLVLIALGGIAIEKRNLDLRRAVSHQNFRQDVLLEDHALHRLKAQQLGAPSRLIDEMPQPEPIPNPKAPKGTAPRFTRPTRPVRSIPAALLDDEMPTH